ncbi:hypothetical protein KIN20_030138 [Parelaphostrongylus tenuis]|uniref:C2H2-type domain-containing protein n=1 Tax=Parelaphostrongylus tenuis TaxID=148309 RepID=A0AAD5R3G5_PARTN|nr:hypothetical protein KIN20_030138 [Parelaphostrongylus tenuis]
MTLTAYEPKCGTHEAKPISYGSIVALPFVPGETLILKRETDEDAVCSAATSNKASPNHCGNHMNPEVNPPSDENKALDCSHTNDVHLEKARNKRIVRPPMNCEECGKRFATIFKLRKHFSIRHIEEPRYSCGQCGQKFVNQKGLNRHDRLVHQRILHMCPYEGCDRPGYKCPKALKFHIRSVHTKVRPHVCETCGKAFITPTRLKKHTQTHSSERKFNCICGAKFRRTFNLKKHQQLCLLN